MLEKDPGDPRLHRLRIIVLMEGDMQIVLKCYFNHHLIPRVEAFDMLVPKKNGNRQGWSTMDCLLTRFSPSTLFA